MYKTQRIGKDFPMSNKNSNKKRVNIDNSTLNMLTALLAISLVLVIVISTYAVIVKVSTTALPDSDTKKPSNPQNQPATYPFKQDISLNISDDLTETREISGIDSGFAALIDITDGSVAASTKSGSIIYPASLTKVMTLIVVYENLPNEAALDEVLTVSAGIGEHSGYGFKVGEQLTVRDLIYAAILQSDGVACLTLADYIAGSEAKFVEMMNAKARELGLSESTTLFQNCSGLHHQYHYSTSYDMAVIMAYAMKNTFCANVLTSLSYRPSNNFRPGEGCVFWHSVLHERLSDGKVQPQTATVTGGKTGWTGKDSGFCMVTFAKGKNGHDYVLVTAKASSWATAVDDMLKIYNNYVE